MNDRFSPFVIKALVDAITGGAGQGPDVTEPIGIYRSGPGSRSAPHTQR
jgi:hypothetical protein